MPLREYEVNEFIEKFLNKKGWVTADVAREAGRHGADMIMFHPKWRKYYIIEIKGESNTHLIQNMHNSFWTILGQILTRMNIEGNNKNKARYYALGIPKKWEKVYKNKIKDMKYGWKLLKLKVFLVNDKGSVEEKPYSYFLKN
jgi:hypothetical protein